MTYARLTASMRYVCSFCGHGSDSLVEHTFHLLVMCKGRGT